MSAAFDTLRLARSLRDKAHFSAEQAEGMADAMSEVLQNDVATKGDVRALKDELKGDVRALKDELKGDIRALKDELQAVKAELKADIRDVESRLVARIETSKTDIFRWVVGLIGFQTIVTLGAALALARGLAR